MRSNYEASRILQNAAESDILESVRAEILKEDAPLLLWAPERLDNTWERQAGCAGAIAGILTGLALGAHMGVAGPWGAIAGTIPCAVIGGVMGYLTGSKAGSRVQRGGNFTLDPVHSNAIKQVKSKEDKTIGSH